MIQNVLEAESNSATTDLLLLDMIVMQQSAYVWKTGILSSWTAVKGYVTKKRD
jgi:hypothetical protein